MRWWPTVVSLVTARGTDRGYVFLFATDLKRNEHT
ncbi:hypothetical protein A2U01_0117618, partial [Trifolium medium]|nr:hypothetical protein [Trifolium medium]